MKRSFLSVVALASACVGCSSTVTADPHDVALDTPFKLSAGVTVRLPGESVHIGWVGLLTDSRCREGLRCASAGYAAVRLWVRQADGALKTVDLRTAPEALQTVQVGEIFLRLDDLDAHPPAAKGRVPAPSTYIATLTASRSSATQGSY
jgi:hypothetical protein